MSRHRLQVSRRCNNQEGFTLLEAMVATLTLAFVLASVLAVGSQCLNYLADIRRASRATQVLQQEMEDIRLMSWSQLQALSGTFRNASDTNGTYAGTITQSGYDSYNGTTTISRVTLTAT
jgi:Tfp pilus assembly protein PilV